MKTVAEVRKSFWETHEEYKKEYKKTYTQNQYRTDIRCSFVEYIDILLKSGQITETMADNITL